ESEDRGSQMNSTRNNREVAFTKEGDCHCRVVGTRRVPLLLLAGQQRHTACAYYSERRIATLLRSCLSSLPAPTAVSSARCSTCPNRLAVPSPYPASPRPNLSPRRCPPSSCRASRSSRRPLRLPQV